MVWNDSAWPPELAAAGDIGRIESMAGLLHIRGLASDVTRLGVSSGDVVMLHASLRAVGPVEGGAVGVIEALRTAVGDSGTLLMVLGARDGWQWVNDLPEPERAAHLGGAEPFDCLTTPADPDVGVLAEAFRCYPGTLVSDHPEGRFAAFGLSASDLVVDPPWDDYFGPGSALERFVGLNGKVLRLGADPDTTTLLHYAENLADVPAKRRVRRHRLVSSPAGPKIRVIDSLDDANGIVDYRGDDYFSEILRAYVSTGRARTGLVGRAASELLSAPDIVEFALSWMTTHLNDSMPFESGADN